MVVPRLLLILVRVVVKPAKDVGVGEHNDRNNTCGH